MIFWIYHLGKNEVNICFRSSLTYMQNSNYFLKSVHLACSQLITLNEVLMTDISYPPPKKKKSLRVFLKSCKISVVKTRYYFFKYLKNQCVWSRSVIIRYWKWESDNDLCVVKVEITFPIKRCSPFWLLSFYHLSPYNFHFSSYMQ